MKISIITATYNSAATVRDTFESVLSQSYKDIEYIVVDGGSKDKTLDIIKEYEARFEGRMTWKSEPDKGIYDAMNKGIQRATGEVVGILNSDDLMTSSDVIGLVVDCFIQYKDTDCVYADLYYVNKDDTTKIVRHWKSGEKRPFALGWHPAHPTFYVKREIYQKYGLFDLNFKLAADFELMLRFVEKYSIKIKYLPRPLVRMRLGGATSKNITNIKKGNIECIKAFRKNKINVSIFYPILRLFPKFKQFFH